MSAAVHAMAFPSNIACQSLVVDPQALFGEVGRSSPILFAADTVTVRSAVDPARKMVRSP